MKFVIRILDASHALLAWAEVHGECRPGGCVMPATATVPMLVERDGRAASVTVEWCDLNLARQEDFLGETDLRAGQMGQFHWIKPLWVVPGEANVPLPPVTVRQSVTIGVPVGSLVGIAP